MNKRPSGRATTALVLLLATVYYFVYHAEYLADPLHFNDDVVQHYLWLYDVNWADDYYARTSGAIQPWGVYGLLWTLGHFIDPLPLSRYGPLLITWLTAGFTVALLRRYVPLVLAIAGAYLVLQYSILTGQGFLARAFSTPLLAMFAYFLVARKVAGIAGTLLLSALFYPPVLLVNGTLLVAWELGRLPFVFRGIHWPRLLREYSVLAVGGITALAVVFLQSYLIHDNPDLGDFFGPAELLAMPEFLADGRVPFSNLSRTPYTWMGRYFSRLYFGTFIAPDFGFFLAAVAGVLGMVTYRKTGTLAAYLLLFVPVTLTLYEVARLNTPLLFLADRYLDYPWRFGVPLLITFVGVAAWQLYPKKWLAYPLALVVFGLGTQYYQPSGLPYMDMTIYAELYDYVSQLPENAMIAAPPEVANFIPLVSRRSVVLSHESAHGLYFRHYYDYITPRFRDYTNAITAPVDSIVLIEEFMDKYAVDYLVIDPRMLESNHHGSFSPYNQLFRARMRVQDPAHYASLYLAENAGERVGEFVVVSKSEVQKLLATPSPPYPSSPPSPNSRD